MKARRVRVPTILQMEAVECGAACLAMVLAHHGRITGLEELRVACGVSRDGSKASSLLAAAFGFGLIGTAYRKEPDELSELPLPLILHWNFNHFVVLEGRRGGRFFINDPAVGPRTVAAAEFDKAFTGVVLAFERGPAFVRGGERRRLVDLLRARLAGSASVLAFVFAASLLLVVPTLIVPAFSKIFIDDVLVKGLWTWGTPLLIAMGVTALLTSALTWLQQSYLLRFEMKLALASSSRFFWHVLRLPVQFFTHRYAGEVGSRVALNDRVAQLLSGDLATTVLQALVVIFLGALMLQYDAVLTLICVVTALLDIAVLNAVARKRVDLNRRLLQDQGKLTGAAMGGLQSIETLKAMGSESQFFARWAGYHAKVLDAQQTLKWQTELLSSVPPLLLAVNASLILGVGGMRVMEGQMSIGMLTAFQAMTFAFMAPVGRMFDFGTTLQEVRGNIDRLDDVLRAAPDRQLEEDASAPVDGRRLSGWVELRDISFGYNPLAQPLIADFNLTLRPGSRVALVGRSGSGKSTIARLVCGLYQPTAGDVLFDRARRTDIPRSVMMNSFAVVDQDIFLFEGTVRENLALWDPTVAEADVIRAAIDAAIHDELTRRPNGYDTKVEEGGRNFSGGQRQRLEIARALVANPSILVLDEATSALDPATEKIVDDNLRRRGCTCLIIAHRLSTIRDCDEIIVLDRGKVVQRGTHDLLKSMPGPYATLIAGE